MSHWGESDANEVLNFVNCWQNWVHRADYWDPVYCTQITIVMTAAFVNTVLLSILLVIHILQHPVKCGLQFWTKPKTWIFILGICMSLIVWSRNFFIWKNIVGSKFDLGLLYV